MDQTAHVVLLDSPGIDDTASVFAEENLLPVPWVEPVDTGNALKE